jgi:ribosomal protein S18 acetylase RimI-like enzyme
LSYLLNPRRFPIHAASLASLIAGGSSERIELERRLLILELRYTISLERASDSSRLLKFMTATQYDFYKRLPSYWHLAVLGVSSRHQRQGIGKKLIQEGLLIAQHEGVPVTLEASVAGRGLYAKLGFKTIERVKIAEDFEEGVAMLWEPVGYEGRWLEPSEDDSSVLRKDVLGS